MKIALISLHFAEYSMNLARELAKDHQVLLLLRKRNAAAELARLEYSSLPENLEVYELNYYPLKNPLWITNFFRIFNKVKQFNPDIIHIQEKGDDDLMLALKALKKWPLAVTIHDHKPHSGADSQQRSWRYKYLYFQRMMSDSLIVHGRKIKEETLGLYPQLEASKVHVLHHGVLGSPVAGIAHDIQQEANTFLFFGRIEAYKGLRCLLDAVKLLQKEQLRFKLIIAGGGSDLDQYRDEISSNPDIELHSGFVPAADVPHLFLKSEAIMMPYTDATQSGVAAMAMGYGRTVIASDVGSIGEVVFDNENGLLVPPKDAVALAAAMKKIIMDKGLLSKLSEQARFFAKEHLSWENIALKTVDVYRAAIVSKQTKLKLP